MTDREVVTNFVGLFLKLDEGQREHAIELLKDYESMKYFWNPNHPVSVRAHICDKISDIMEWKTSDHYLYLKRMEAEQRREKFPSRRENER